MSKLDLETGLFKRRVVQFFSETDNMIQHALDVEADHQLKLIGDLRKKRLRGKKKTEEEAQDFFRSAMQDENAALETLTKEFNKSNEKVEMIKSNLFEAKEKLATSLYKQVVLEVYLHHHQSVFTLYSCFDDIALRESFP
jgi:hypothetical protein